MRKVDIPATAHARLLLLGLGFSVRVRVVNTGSMARMGGAAHCAVAAIVYFFHDLLIFLDTGTYITYVSTTVADALPP